MCLEIGFHGLVAALLGPVALQTGRHLDAGSAAHGLGKALAALYRRRASLETFYLYYGACALELRGYVLAYLASHELIVGSDVGSELLGIGFSVEHYHRYALVVGPVDGRSDGCHLVWRHDEQVDTERNEAVDLGYLRGIVVIGRGEYQLYLVMEECSDAQFVVKFVAPDVFRTLRHADKQFVLVIIAATQQHCDKQS